MAHIPYYSEDALDQAVTISLEQLRQDNEPSEQQLAGIDDLTPVDTFIKGNGEAFYVTS